MFFEFEKECLCEEGVIFLVELLSQVFFEGLVLIQDVEDLFLISYFLGVVLEQEQYVGFLSVRIKDFDIGLDGEYCNVLDFFQVFKVVEFCVQFDSGRDVFIISKECEKVFFSFKIGGEFKFLVDLELYSELDIGGLLNFNFRVFCEENLLVFIVFELVKENGNLFQVDCSQIEGNVEEYMERIFFSFVFNYE